jgi:hypothetical protein
MLFAETNAAYCENHMKHRNTPWAERRHLESSSVSDQTQVLDLILNLLNAYYA